MEKFCIVKRRKKDTNDPAIERTKFLNSFPGVNNKNGHSSENSSENKKESLKFSLTAEQCDIVKKSDHFKALLNGTANGYNITMDNQENGKILFNLNFTKVENLKLLKSKQVCKMMQVSKYFLRKLVKQNKIRSFKIGRLRRFALKDVLNFIDKSEDIYKSDSIVIFNNKI